MFSESRINKLREIKQHLRDGRYAWPGGYPLYFITSDGAALSFEAVRQEWPQVAYSVLHGLGDGWNVLDTDVNWEDSTLRCDHTGEQIEAAYDSEA